MEQRVKKKIEFRYMENVILNQNEKFKQLINHMESSIKIAGLKETQMSDFAQKLDNFKFEEVYTDHDLWKKIHQDSSLDSFMVLNSK